MKARNIYFLIQFCETKNNLKIQRLLDSIISFLPVHLYIFSQHLSSLSLSKFALHNQLEHFCNQHNMHAPKHRLLYYHKCTKKRSYIEWSKHLLVRELKESKSL